MSETGNGGGREERRSGVDRRADPPGRVVYSRGPIIRALEVLSAFSGLAAIGALIFALSAISDQVSTIQSARQKSAFDTCQVLTKLLDLSASRATPYSVRDTSGRIIGQLDVPDQHASVANFIRRAGLANCQTYAIQVRNGTLRTPVLKPERRF